MGPCVDPSVDLMDCYRCQTPQLWGEESRATSTKEGSPPQRAVPSLPGEEEVPQLLMLKEALCGILLVGRQFCEWHLGGSGEGDLNRSAGNGVSLLRTYPRCEIC